MPFSLSMCIFFRTFVAPLSKANISKKINLKTIIQKYESRRSYGLNQRFGGNDSRY